MTDSFEIFSVNVGKPASVEFQEKTVETGIYKISVREPVFLSKLNLDGDAQADLKNHGGPDKAACVYPLDHYPYWGKELNRSLGVPAFGENFTVRGLTEKDVHIGDIFQFGDAVVQVTQPRQPCFKLANKLGERDLPYKVQKTGYTGFYFRVLQEGLVSKHHSLKRVSIHPKKFSVAQANDLKYQDKNNEQAISAILDIKELSESWRKTFFKRLNNK